LREDCRLPGSQEEAKPQPQFQRPKDAPVHRSVRNGTLST
jgi:hypothetical protein